MQNKIAEIDGAIEHCEKLMNGDAIALNGLHKIVLERGYITDDDFKRRIFELQLEKSNLQERISRFKR